jgi:hypothetical protein
VIEAPPPPVQTPTPAPTPTPTVTTVYTPPPPPAPPPPPTPPAPIVITPIAPPPALDPVKAAANAAATRKRGMAGTVTTSWRGVPSALAGTLAAENGAGSLLSPGALAPQRKRLLGE